MYRAVWAGLPLAVLCAMPYAALAASDPCSGIDQQLTAARRQEYALLVPQCMTAKVKPSSIKVFAIMEQGEWSVAYVSTLVSDNGYFFFHNVDGRQKCVDVWGGMADSSNPGEDKAIADWARKLGAPDQLARCFAHNVPHS